MWICNGNSQSRRFNPSCLVIFVIFTKEVFVVCNPARMELICFSRRSHFNRLWYYLICGAALIQCANLYPVHDFVMSTTCAWASKLFFSSEFPTFEEYGFCVVACSGTLPLESWVGSGLSLSGHWVWNLTTFCGCFQRARRSELVFNFKSIWVSAFAGITYHFFSKL